MIPKNYPVIVQFALKHGKFSAIVEDKESYIDVCYKFIMCEIDNELSLWRMSEKTTVESYVRSTYGIDIETYEMILTNPKQTLVTPISEVRSLVNDNLCYNKHISDAQGVAAGTHDKVLSTRIMSFMFPERFKVITPGFE